MRVASTTVQRAGLAALGRGLVLRPCPYLLEEGAAPRSHKRLRGAGFAVRTPLYESEWIVPLDGVRRKTLTMSNV